MDITVHTNLYVDCCNIDIKVDLCMPGCSDEYSEWYTSAQ